MRAKKQDMIQLGEFWIEILTEMTVNLLLHIYLLCRLIKKMLNQAADVLFSSPSNNLWHFNMNAKIAIAILYIPAYPWWLPSRSMNFLQVNHLWKLYQCRGEIADLLHDHPGKCCWQLQSWNCWSGLSACRTAVMKLPTNEARVSSVTSVGFNISLSLSLSLDPV